MHRPKIYRSNAALSYRNYAILIRCENSTYLVIDTEGDRSFIDSPYKIGCLVQLDNYEVEETTYDISQSPINDNYLFNYFLNTHSYEKEG